MRTIALRLTGRGTGAIGVLLVAGQRAGAVVAAIVRENRRERVAGMRIGEVLRCDLIKAGDVIDDALAVRIGPDRWELHVHGGVAVMEAVQGALADAGATVVNIEEAGAMAAFWGGIEGEIATVLPLARTMTGARLITAQADTGLSRFAAHWLGRLKDRGTADLWRLQSAVQWLQRRSQTLMGLLEPPRAAIVGLPNAGKSTLANALLGRTASITSDVPGTTRDWVESETVLTAPTASPQESETGNLAHSSPSDGHRRPAANPPQVAVPVVLVDTAGIRETGDPVEREAIGRANRQALAANVVVLVLDASRALTAEERELASKYGAKRLLIAVNKMDAAAGDRAGAVSDARRIWPGAVEISALRGDGLEQLMTAILRQLDLARIGADEPFAFTPRQQRLLAEIALAGNTHRAAALLRELASGAAE